jgi:hypothetical protein
MPMGLLSKRHDRQVDQAKGLQQGFRCRTTSGAFWVARIQARHAFVLVCQALAASPLHHRQQTQGQREQMNETRRTLVTLYLHRGEGEGLADHSTKAALHQILFAVGQHRLLQRERLLRMIGDVDAPP